MENDNPVIEKTGMIDLGTPEGRQEADAIEDGIAKDPFIKEKEEPVCDTVGMKETDPIEGKEEDEPTEAEVEIKELYVCPDCDETEEDFEMCTLYECGSCGEVFSKDESDYGSHRCNCGKYAGLLCRHGCPNCHVETEKQTVYEYEGTIYTDVEALREAIEENGEVISDELEEELKNDSVTPEPQVEADEEILKEMQEMQETEKSDPEERNEQRDESNEATKM